MGIPVLRHDEKKPGGVAEVLAFFEGKGSEGEPVGLVWQSRWMHPWSVHVAFCPTLAFGQETNVY